MTNYDLTKYIFHFLQSAEVETVVVCAGARNAPLVLGLKETNFKVIQFFEERSAAFYALGLMKATQKPVAILTTSGTAVAELLPATIEAFFQGLPLMIISADRPKSYRRTGAPQSIEQVGLFSTYVSHTYDFDQTTTDFKVTWNAQKPLHLNVCFDEPLIDQATTASKKILMQNQKLSFSKSKSILPESIQNPLLIVGELQAYQVDQVIQFILKHQIPTYAESLSQLRHRSELAEYLIFSSDRLVNKYFKNKTFQSVIRSGGVPTLRFWRDLESEFLSIPVYNLTDLEFTGLSKKSFLNEFNLIEKLNIQSDPNILKKIKSDDERLQKKKYELLQKYPLSEPAFIFAFSKQIENKAVYLGNSLPIRHWDSFTSEKSSQVNANRGANGIDGQISTYLGWSENLIESFCLIGDLTALYDLASLGLTPQLAKNKRRVVVLNNFGGQIFNRVFKNELFVNPHQTQFKSWAEMWSWEYRLMQTDFDFSQLKLLTEINVIIELQPQAEQTKLFWDDWDQACQSI